MKTFLMKTNSWHWLAAALLLSFIVMCWLWSMEVSPVRESVQAEIQRMEQRLQKLQSMEPERVDIALANERRWKNIQEREAKAYAALKVDPLPYGNDAIFAVKNKIDAALTARGLRVASSEVQVALPKDGPSSKVSAARKDDKKKQPLTADAYLAQASSMASRLDPKERGEFMAQARLRAQQLRATQAKMKEKADARASAVASVARRNPSAGKLPFKSSEIFYTADGDFRNMFLFLVGETFLKSAYHLKDIAVVQLPEGGARMTFTLQVDYR